MEQEKMGGGEDGWRWKEAAEDSMNGGGKDGRRRGWVEKKVERSDEEAVDLNQINTNDGQLPVRHSILLTSGSDTSTDHSLLLTSFDFQFEASFLPRQFIM
ncbi:hypothetical protein LINGRAHAP2_LOCUS14898 [Linum grandiflorum]